MLRSGMSICPRTVWHVAFRSAETGLLQKINMRADVPENSGVLFTDSAKRNADMLSKHNMAALLILRSVVDASLIHSVKR
jgi:hypothetical protein